jgi:predicted 3-demethylubiquinone-9 3-methyltransferase (glyoxalase superfamily)
MKNEIYPCLWFNQNAREAAKYYLNIFKDSRITSENAFVVMLEINHFKLMLMNGGPEFKFSEATSLVVSCDTQNEIDYYWNTLAKDGEEGKCGWLKDKFGFSWQIVPSQLGKWMTNSGTAPKVMYAFMQMTKFDISKLEEAAKN